MYVSVIVAGLVGSAHASVAKVAIRSWLPFADALWLAPVDLGSVPLVRSLQSTYDDPEMWYRFCRLGVHPNFSSLIKTVLSPRRDTWILFVHGNEFVIGDATTLRRELETLNHQMDEQPRLAVAGLVLVNGHWSRQLYPIRLMDDSLWVWGPDSGDALRLEGNSKGVQLAALNGLRLEVRP